MASDVDVIRQAVTVIRERAGAASEVPPHRWVAGKYEAVVSGGEFMPGFAVAAGAETFADLADEATTHHIAAADPTVMLAVADLLAAVADFAEVGEPLPDDMVDELSLAAARAYLRLPAVQQRTPGPQTDEQDPSAPVADSTTSEGEQQP